MTLQRIESYPFTSRFDGYDDEGYPIYDRAVNSVMMRSVYKQFFSDGIFGTPADAWDITPSGDGLSVIVKPGVAIIHGAMAAIYSDGVLLPLDNGPTVGKAAYSVFLRYDGNDEYRSLFLRIKRSDYSTNPIPPSPQEGPEVKELRLGYVVVPANATDLTDAVITMERGTALCPYAAPFEDIDVSEVVADVRAQASREYNRALEQINAARGLLEAALDETTAGALATRVEALENPLVMSDEQVAYYAGLLEEKPIGWPDGWKTYAEETAAGTSDFGGLPIVSSNMGAVVSALGGKIKKEGGTKWYVGSSYATQRTGAQLTPTPTEIDGEAELDSFYFNPKWGVCYRCVQRGNAGESRWDFCFATGAVSSIESLTFSEIAELSELVRATPEMFTDLIGATKYVSGVQYRILGLMHDVDENDRPIGITMQTVECIGNHVMNSTNTTSGGWPASQMYTYLNNDVFNGYPEDLRKVIKTAKKQYSAANKGAIQTTMAKVFIPTEKEVYGTSNYDNAGTRYEWYAANPSASSAIKKVGSSAVIWWLGSVYSSNFFAVVHSGGSLGYNGANYSHGVAPCFCI